MKGLITGIKHHSPAQRAGICPGEALTQVNGTAVRDIIDYSYLQNDENIELCLEKNGKSRTVRLTKSRDEDLGLEFQSAVFDKVKLCRNKCIFCFVDQMIPGMRRGLYVRDDDYRLSFLYGNFITLTNLTGEDIERILRLHLSPLYISIHVTDSDMRCQMMHNPGAGDILTQIKKLAKQGILFHTQIVSCPGYNDGAVLEKTFRDLAALYPAVLSVAVVPVGLTKHRENLPQLRCFSAAECKKMCHTAAKWQQQCRRDWGKNFIYLSDEFYLAGGVRIPEAEEYDNFPQLENGIGLTRVFLDEWTRTFAKLKGCKASLQSVIPVGEAAYGVLQPFVEQFNQVTGGRHQLLKVKNTFFGGAVNVTGLLCGSDILNATKGKDRVILPGVVLNRDNLFLDDMTLEDFKKHQQGRVEIARSARELLNLLADR